MTVEIMNEVFTKYHLGHGMVLHHFTGIETGYPHDHPFDFTTEILFGDYIERIYTINYSRWTSKEVTRLAGTLHFVPAETIHQIIAFPEGECWTLITPKEHRRVSRFWRSDPNGNIYSRAWNEQKWTKYE